MSYQTIRLETPRQVMEAFLGGCKLIHDQYGSDADGDTYLYMHESGWLCEEDGAGAKAHRVDLTFRGGDPGWRILTDVLRATPPSETRETGA